MAERYGRPIVFLSDYGLADEFVGICHAVIARIAPHSSVIDLSHAITPQDVLDNGLLSLAWAREGGLVHAREISSPGVILEPVSATFHGRDIFAPAAAHLAVGTALGEIGPPIDPSSLVSIAWPSPNVEPSLVETEVLGVDRFGNVQLSGLREDLERAGLADSERLEVVTRGRTPTAVRRASTFGEVTEGEAALIVDSSGSLALVVNRGSAAEVLGLATGDPVSLRRPGVP